MYIFLRVRARRATFFFPWTEVHYFPVYSRKMNIFSLSRRGIRWKNIIEHSENNGPASMKMNKSVARVHEIPEN